MNLPIAFGRRFRRWHLLGVVLVVVGVWVVYALLFQLADSLISSMRYVKECLGRIRKAILLTNICTSSKTAEKSSSVPKRRRMETSLVVAHYLGAGNLFGNLTDGELIGFAIFVYK